MHIVSHDAPPRSHRLDCFVVMLKFMNELSFHYLAASTPESAKVSQLLLTLSISIDNNIVVIFVQFVSCNCCVPHVYVYYGH